MIHEKKPDKYHESECCSYCHGKNFKDGSVTYFQHNGFSLCIGCLFEMADKLLNKE